ncbi:hypothetical protein [Okeania sp. SIO1I7]|uniref:hypothetical protein n=1 Tax=Okeania sp. SIO1I7 TaxID=2607772 RepID=UPI0025FBCA1F|nr:hypothetical protein [Okeania sp. SIO1I7]
MNINTANSLTLRSHFSALKFPLLLLCLAILAINGQANFCYLWPMRLVDGLAL